MTPRRSTRSTQASAQVSRVSQSRTRPAPAPASTTPSRSSPRKRKGGQTGPDEAATPSTPRATKRTRTTTIVANQETEVVDLTGSPQTPKSTPRKRKQAGSGWLPAAQQEEKRLRPFRKWAPQTYLLKLDRARTQRLFVLNRRQDGTEEVPTQVVDIVGSTGNVYQVTIDKIPRCTCPDNCKGNQCKHIVYVLYNVLKAPHNLQYQLAFLSSDLREIFQNAPPSPTDSASKQDAEGKRKEISGDCPICFMEFEPENEEIVWCKVGCGNNVHKACFQKWMSSKRGSQVSCVYCRTPWESDKPSSEDVLKQGYINDEGYLNVGGSMGLPEERDYSTYHYSPWFSRRSRYAFY